MNNPIFTVFVIAYYPPKYLPILVESILNQTYDNLEIIIVNHAAHHDTVDYINKVKQLDDRVKVVNYKYNLINSGENGIIVWNDVLSKSEGEYILHVSDDNVLSHNYIEKMVKLFLGNKECTTAAGIVPTIDADGNLETKKLENGVRVSNYRPRYMPGRFLALDILNSRPSRMFSSAGGGTIFAIKKSSLVDAGGYHAGIEDGVTYGVLPFGVTGFDEEAIFYWRHHSRQLNKELLERGWIGSEEHFAMLEDLEINNKWKIFGDSIAKHVVDKLTKLECKRAAWWFVDRLYRAKIKPAWKLFSAVGFRPYFVFVAIPFSMLIQLKKLKTILTNN